MNQQVGRQDANGGVAQERRKGFLEGELDDVGIELDDLHASPELSQIRGSPIDGILHGPDSEDHIVSAEGNFIVPKHIVPQVEGVAEAIAGDLPPFGQIWDNLTPLIELGEAIEYEGTKVSIYLVLAEEGVDILRLASQALYVGPANIGDKDCGEGKGQVGQQRAQ
jgi:hypothetical protein